VSSSPGRERRRRGGHLGAGAVSDERHEAEVIDVLVCEDDELDVLQRVPKGVDATRELVE
jgi:hypothetical protein